MIDNLREIISDELSEEELRNSLGQKFLNRFLSGDNLELNEQEYVEAIGEACLSTAYNSLVDKGLLDFIEDENGEQHFFLTEFGSQLGHEIIKQNGRHKS
jgi:hypothetical protein